MELYMIVGLYDHDFEGYYFSNVNTNLFDRDGYYYYESQGMERSNIRIEDVISERKEYTIIHVDDELIPALEDASRRFYERRGY